MMAVAKTATVVVDDLFGGPPLRLGEAPEDPRATPPAPPRKRRKVHGTQREGHARILRAAPTIDERVAAEIKGNGKLGRSRQEIADRTDIAINSVCGAVDRLMKAGKVFEPVIGHEGAVPLHFRRDRRKVVVDALYSSFDWLDFGRRVQHG